MKLPVVDPAGMLTLAGTVADEEFEARLTVVAEVCFAEIVTVPADE